MDEFYETQMSLASDKADKADSAEAEQSVKLSQGQTPTIDADVYDPKAVRDAGYPISNPTIEPNKHTKPGARMFGGRDASNGQPVLRPITMPEGRLETSVFSKRMEPIYSGLAAAENAFTVETGISKAFEQMIKYTNSLSDMDPTEADSEANRVKWATSDRLEAIGFDHVSNSERTSEGIDDKGLDGLQMMMSAQIMRGIGDFDSVTSAIGDTGANTEQLEETWNKAVDAYNRARQGVIQGLPTDRASAMKDPRYLAAAGIVSDAIGERGPAKDLDEEALYDQGMLLVDLVKGNPLYLIAIIHKAKKDPIIADALNLLLDADDEMDLTWGDFGRGVYGAVLDPLSYFGIGLAGRAIRGAGRGLVVRQAMKAAGLAGVEASVLTGAYANIMDHGFQNIDVLAGRQEEFSVSQSLTATGIGAAAGFVFGAALSGLTTGTTKLLDKWVRRNGGSGTDIIPHPDYTDRYNVLDLPNQPDNIPASDDFAGIPLPENVASPLELDIRRQVVDMQNAAGIEAAINPPEGQTSGSVGFVDTADDLTRQTEALIDTEIAQFGSDTIAVMIMDTRDFKGVNPEQLYDDILAAMDTVTDNFHNPPDGSLESQGWLLAHKTFKEDRPRFVEMINKHRGLKVIEGGKPSDASDDPDHMAQMRLVQTKINKDTTLDAIAELHKEMRTDLQKDILAKAEIVEEHVKAGDFRFKIDEEVTSKHSGKKFKIHHLIWDEKTGEAQYRVVAYDGARHNMSEWGIVGGKPKLGVVPKGTGLTATEEFEMAGVALKHDQRAGAKLAGGMSAEKQRFTTGKNSDIIKNYKTNPDTPAMSILKDLDLNTLTSEDLGKLEIEDISELITSASSDNDKLKVLNKMYADEYDQLEMPAKRDARRLGFFGDVLDEQLFTDTGEKVKPNLKLAPNAPGFNEKVIADFEAARAIPDTIEGDAADEIIDVVETALRNTDEIVSDRELKELLTDAVNDVIVDEPELAKEMEKAINSPEFIEYIKAVRKEEMQDLTSSKLRDAGDAHSAIFDSGKKYADMEKDFAKLYESIDAEQLRYIVEDSPARMLTSPLFTASVKTKLGEYKPGSGLYVDPKLIDADKYLEGFSKLTSKRIAELHKANKIGTLITDTKVLKNYKNILSDAKTAMTNSDTLEPTSALKQAASDKGIAWGDDMERFVKWAWREMFDEEHPSFTNKDLE